MTHERAPFGGLTDAEIGAIAERAAKKALQSVYAEVGQSVLKRLAWLVGLVVDRACALARWREGADTEMSELLIWFFSLRAYSAGRIDMNLVLSRWNGEA